MPGKQQLAQARIFYSGRVWQNGNPCFFAGSHGKLISVFVLQLLTSPIQV